MLSSLLLSLLVVGAPLADLPAAGAVERLAMQAQRDFDLTHEELGLLGSAPLYGLEEIQEPQAAEHSAAGLAVRAPMGAAPLFGLEELAPLPATPATRR